MNKINENMIKACNLAKKTLDYIHQYIKEGVTTDELNTLCHEFILKNKAIPAPLNYMGYPKSICTSVNEVVCHGIPNNRMLLKGDIINVDVTVIVNNWHGDSSRMYTVGKIHDKYKQLIEITEKAMFKGIEQIAPGKKTGDIGHAIQNYVEKNGYSVVKDYCGHGIGEKFHMHPCVPSFGKSNSGDVLREGMFITVEPMVNIGSDKVKLDEKDGWTVTTCDGSYSAQFEHTVAVVKNGYKILTK